MNVDRKLYLSHLLTSWVDRSFEFASYLLISRVYTTSLLQASIYGLSTTLIALVLSPHIGNWINILSRLQTYRVTLFVQKGSILISTVLFHVLNHHSASAGGGTQNVSYAFIIVFGCTLKLAFIGNSIAIEKDWAMIISDGHLERLLPTMRRIDLVCKTLSPIFVGYLLLAPPLAITLVICSWTCASAVVEYLLVSQIYRAIPALSLRTPYSPSSSSSSPSPSNAGEEDASVAVPLGEYVRHKTFLCTLSLAILYMNVLSFGGTMTSYLVLIGYSSGLLGIMKAVAGIMGVAGTYAMPLMAERIGNIRTGLWSIWQLALTLVLVVVALALRNALGPTATSVLVFGGMAASRLGLWIFDIAENLILQEYTASSHITSISGWQYSLCNLFDLLQYGLTIVVSDPAKFIIPASISSGSILGAAIIYTWFVWKDRGHLLHPLKLK
ncbi:hypothetical protein BGZ98_003363 [Dissophora globulifera]|nr:hypothetical protein BGZ98_003363 [Dissophora globulifera]